jgi:DNA invertase Pin-like site-specific DNA recombinase
MGQVENGDIPTQRAACQEFAVSKGWEVIEEFVEKGVSGFKISAYDREAMQKIKNDAVMQKFDILLVFMFDRLGRRDNETSFVVQWFIRNGIEVWSVKEGEQRIESHVDKLLNYIRYWQAQGESENTSIRVKAAHAQLTRNGHFRVGTVPFGYRLEHKGRVNKRGIPVGDYVIDEQETVAIRLMFDRYVNHGYGTQRLCSYLAELGLTPRVGGRFVNTTINNMLKRSLYIGILSTGGVQSDFIPELQIVSQAIFDRARR